MSSTWNFKKQFFVLFWHHFWELEETDMNAALPLRSSEWAGGDSPVTASHHGDRDMHSSRHAAHALGTWRNHWGLKGHWETFTQGTVLQGKQRPLNLWKPRILNELSPFSLLLGPTFTGRVFLAGAIHLLHKKNMHQMPTPAGSWVLALSSLAGRDE